MIDSFALFKRLFLSSQPVYLIQYVTARCNLHCKMCFYEQEIRAGKVKDELSLEEFRKIAKHFPQLIQLSIGGGEPFMREDLADIVMIFKELTPVRYITLPTNATFPETIEQFLHSMLPRLYPVHLRMSLSLDGIGVDHDFIRGKEGAFKLFNETYNRISPLRSQYSNFSLDIVSTCSAFNYDKIGEMYGYVQKYYDADNFGLLLVRGNVRDEVKKVVMDYYKTVAAASDENNIKKSENRPYSIFLRSLTAELHNLIYETMLHNRYCIPCEAGRRMLVISEEGAVKPCEILDINYGNMRNYDYDLSKIMEQQIVKDHVRSIKKDKCFCTFECAYSLNVLFQRKSNILARAIRSIVMPEK